MTILRKTKELNMIGFISNKVFIYLQNCGILEKNSTDENNWLKYGIEITVSSTFGLLIILVLSAVFNRLPVGIAFLSVFVPIRQFTGGYHAESYLKCNLTFTVCYLLILLLHRIDGTPLYLHLPMLAAGLAVTAALTPVKNRHKPLGSKARFYRCKVLGTALYLIFGSVGIFAVCRGFNIGKTIFHTLYSVVILVVIGFIKERRSSYEKTEQNG